MLILAAAKWMPPWQLPLFWSLNVEGSCGSFVLLAQLLGLRGGNGLSVARPATTSRGRPAFPSWLPPPSPDPKVPPAHPPAQAEPLA